MEAEPNTDEPRTFGTDLAWRSPLALGPSLCVIRRCAKVRTHQLFIVACEHVPVCKPRMGPAHSATFVELGECRLQKLCAGEFFEALWRQACDQQFTTLIEHPHVLAVLDEVDRGPALSRHSGAIFP